MICSSRSSAAVDRDLSEECKGRLSRHPPLLSHPIHRDGGVGRRLRY